MLEFDVDDQTFNGFRELIYQIAGIEYPPSKKSLFQNRLRKRLVALGLESPGDYLEMLKSARGADELREFLDVITTNETYFFRCARHWEFVRRFLRERDSEIPAGRKIRIWSAASSTGAEAYSTAIVLHEEFGKAKVAQRFEIVGTDLNQKVLEQARAGAYEGLALREVDEGRRGKWFRKVEASPQTAAGCLAEFEIDPALKTNVTFARHNLKDAWSGEPFDLLLLRNVMIYFDRPSKEHVLARAFDAMRPGAALLLGESESLVQVTHGFENGETSVLYRPAQ